MSDSPVLSSPFCCPNHKNHPTLSVCTTPLSLSLCATPSSSFHPSCLFLPLTANLKLSLYLYKASFLGSVWVVGVCVCARACVGVCVSMVDKRQVFTHTHTHFRTESIFGTCFLVAYKATGLSSAHIRSYFLGNNRTIKFKFSPEVAPHHLKLKNK